VCATRTNASGFLSPESRFSSPKALKDDRKVRYSDGTIEISTVTPLNVETIPLRTNPRVTYNKYGVVESVSRTVPLTRIRNQSSRNHTNRSVFGFDENNAAKTTFFLLERFAGPRAQATNNNDGVNDFSSVACTHARVKNHCRNGEYFVTSTRSFIIDRVCSAVIFFPTVHFVSFKSS